MSSKKILFFLIPMFLLVLPAQTFAQEITLGEVILSSAPSTQEEPSQFLEKIDTVIPQIEWLPDRRIPGVIRAGRLPIHFANTLATSDQMKPNFPVIEVAATGNSKTPHLRLIIPNLKTQILKDEFDDPTLYTNHIFYTYLRNEKIPAHFIRSDSVGPTFSSGLYQLNQTGKSSLWLVLQTVTSPQENFSILSIYYNEEDALSQYNKPIKNISLR